MRLGVGWGHTAKGWWWWSVAVARVARFVLFFLPLFSLHCPLCCRPVPLRPCRRLDVLAIDHGKALIYRVVVHEAPSGGHGVAVQGLWLPSLARRHPWVRRQRLHQATNDWLLHSNPRQGSWKFKFPPSSSSKFKICSEIFVVSVFIKFLFPWFWR